MKKCIDCDYVITCNKSSRYETCERYVHTAEKHTPKKYTKLDKVENGVYEFSKLEVIENEKSNI